MSPSGSRTARPNRRVETLISIRFIAQRPSRSSERAASQLGSAISWPLRARTRGRSSDTLPPWNPILPGVLPQRWPALPSLWPYRGPHRSSASYPIIRLKALTPAVRQKYSKLVPTCRQASATVASGTALIVSLPLPMALLSFVDPAPRAYSLKAGNAARKVSTDAGTSPSRPPWISAGRFRHRDHPARVPSGPSQRLQAPARVGCCTVN